MLAVALHVFDRPVVRSANGHIYVGPPIRGRMAVTHLNLIDAAIKISTLSSMCVSYRLGCVRPFRCRIADILGDFLPCYLKFMDFIKTCTV